jgi:hypothetical protein
MLHLCHAYFAHYSEAGEQDRIPFAQPSTDGGMAAKQVLSGQGDVLIFNHGTGTDDQIRLRNLLVDISANMTRSLSRGVRPRSRCLLGPELMDVITEPDAGALLTEVASIDFPSAAPAALIPLVDSVYICSNLGSAIRATDIPGNITCSCAILDENKAYLAAHMKCLEEILARLDCRLQSLQHAPLKISNQAWWIFKPFTPCSHLANASFGLPLRGSYNGYPATEVSAIQRLYRQPGPPLLPALSFSEVRIASGTGSGGIFEANHGPSPEPHTVAGSSFKSGSGFQCTARCMEPQRLPLNQQRNAEEAGRRDITSRWAWPPWRKKPRRRDPSHLNSSC